MDAIQAVAFLAVFSAPPASHSSYASNQNFGVLSHSDEMAQQVLKAATAYRKQLASEWRGKPLEDGAGYAVIEWNLAEHSDEGRTWLADPPLRKNHVVSITATRRGLPGILRHECAHLYVRTAFADGIPAWADEGIACQYDDDEIRGARRRLAREMDSNGRSLKSLFEAKHVSGDLPGTDCQSAAAVEFLLSRGDRAKFIQFVQRGTRAGWDFALRDTYKIRDTTELARLLQAWLATQN